MIAGIKLIKRSNSITIQLPLQYIIRYCIHTSYQTQMHAVCRFTSSLYTVNIAVIILHLLLYDVLKQLLSIQGLSVTPLITRKKKLKHCNLNSEDYSVDQYYQIRVISRRKNKQVAP